MELSIMQLYPLIVLLIVVGLTGIGIGRYAYRLGLRHGRATSIPFQLIDALLDHKIHCLGEEPALARVELETALDLEEWDSQSLMRRVLHSPRRRTLRSESSAPSLPAEMNNAASHH